MTVTAWTIITTAIAIGVAHTLAGPDHYVPFIALSRARRWSLRKTLAITAACGVGHIAGSVILGLIGVAILTGVDALMGLESVRGELAAWMLVAFGGMYVVWGFTRYARNRRHSHAHVHADGTVHAHQHDHHGQHAHVHDQPGSSATTAWAIFIIFVFGPCEVLIPMLMLPALADGWLLMTAVVTAFAVSTMATMMLAVTVGVYGLDRLGATVVGRWLAPLGRHVHTVTGLAIMLCGGLMLVGF